MQKEISNYTFNHGVKNGLPIGLGYLAVSFAFGVQASMLGIPWWISLLTSLTNMTSAGQLAGIEIMATASGTLVSLILTMLLTQIVINARYFLMSVSLTQKLDDSFTLPKRFLCSFAVTDEIFAVSVVKPKPIGTKYFLGLALLPYTCWALGTLLGSLASQVLPSTIVESLGIALYAMFIAIIIPPSTKSLGVALTVLLSAGISCIFYFVPALKVINNGLVYVICAISVAVIMALLFPVKQINDSEPAKNTQPANAEKVNPDVSNDNGYALNEKKEDENE